MAIQLEDFKEILRDLCPFCRKRAVERMAELLAIPAPTSLKPRAQAEISIADLLSRVAEKHEMSASRLIEGGNARNYVSIRREFCLEARKLGYSFPQIGRTLNRHHTTIQHLVKSGKNGHASNNS